MIKRQYGDDEQIFVFVGDIIKIVFEPTDVDHKLANAERMWVIVTEYLGDNVFAGVLDNDPYLLTSISYLDPVKFHVDQVIDKMKDTSNIIPDYTKKYSNALEKNFGLDHSTYKHIDYQDYDNQTKIIVATDKDYEDKYAREELIVEELSFRMYRIICIPSCVKKVCYGDIITFYAGKGLEYSVQEGEYTTLFIRQDEDNFDLLDEYNYYIIKESQIKYLYLVAFKIQNIKHLLGLIDAINSPQYTYNIQRYPQIMKANKTVPLEKLRCSDGLVLQHWRCKSYDLHTKIVLQRDKNMQKFVKYEELIVEDMGDRRYRIICVPQGILKLGYMDVVQFSKNSNTRYKVEQSEYVSLFVNVIDNSKELFEEEYEFVFKEHLWDDQVALAIHGADYFRTEEFIKSLSDEERYQLWSNRVEKFKLSKE
jgi:Uncharacterized protein conserved in bacteria (DUF2314)